MGQSAIDRASGGAGTSTRAWSSSMQPPAPEVFSRTSGPLRPPNPVRGDLRSTCTIIRILHVRAQLSLWAVLSSSRQYKFIICFIKHGSSCRYPVMEVTDRLWHWKICIAHNSGTLRPEASNLGVCESFCIWPSTSCSLLRESPRGAPRDI